MSQIFSQKFIGEASFITARIAWVDSFRASGTEVLYVSGTLWQHASWLRLCGYRVTGDDPRSLGMFISW